MSAFQGGIGYIPVNYLDMRSKMTDAQFAEAIAQSLSVAQVIVRLGLVPAGGNYKTVQARIARLELSTAHFTGQGWNTGRRFQQFGRRAEWKEILIENSSYTSTNRLKIRLVDSGYKQAQCEECGLREWLKRPISLELHHLNGINNDHRIENLQLLCPNCHAQTASYRGKNKQARVV